MPLSKREYDKMMADPARAEAARQASDTRLRRQARRVQAIRVLQVKLGRWPTEDEIREAEHGS